MKVCGAPTVCRPSYNSSCTRAVAAGAERCYQHGGPSGSPRSQSQRRYEQKRRAEARRDAYVRQADSLDADARRRKVARWMLGSGGEAFAEFAQSLVS